MAKNVTLIEEDVSVLMFQVSADAMQAPELQIGQKITFEANEVPGLTVTGWITSRVTGQNLIFVAISDVEVIDDDRGQHP